MSDPFVPTGPIFDHEQAYTDLAVPLIEALTAVCEANGIQYVMGFTFARQEDAEKEGFGSGMMISCDSKRAGSRLSAAAMVLLDDERAKAVCFADRLTRLAQVGGVNAVMIGPLREAAAKLRQGDRSGLVDLFASLGITPKEGEVIS